VTCAKVGFCNTQNSRPRPKIMIGLIFIFDLVYKEGKSAMIVYNLLILTLPIFEKFFNMYKLKVFFMIKPKNYQKIKNT
jgi:hypothetical protein